MKPTYRIKDWDQNFENAKSRTYEKCSFVCLPNKHHGLGFTRIMAQPDGAAIFGIWCLLVQAASRQPRPRAGWLTEDGTREGSPWASDDLALRWRRTEQEINRALTFLSSKGIGWIEIEYVSGGGEIGAIQSESLGPIPQETEVSVEYPPGSPIKNRIERTELKRIERTEDPQRANARLGCRIPDDFSISDTIRKFADAFARDVDLDTALAEFKDYWIAVPGQRGRKLDWDATFRNRLRALQGKAKKNGNGNGSYQQNSPAQRSSGSLFKFQPRSKVC